MAKRKVSKADFKKAIETGRPPDIDRLFPDTKEALPERDLRAIRLNCLTVACTLGYGYVMRVPYEIILSLSGLLVGAMIVMEIGPYFLKKKLR